MNEAGWEVRWRKERGLRAGAPPPGDSWHKPVLLSDRFVTTDSRGCLLDANPGGDAASVRPGTEGAWRVVRLHERWRQGLVALCASLMVAGCSASRPGARGQYEQARDSATQASLSRPALAVRQVGEKTPVIPPLRPIRAPAAGALGAAGVLGGNAVIDASKSLDAGLLSLIDKALSKCAAMARADVMYMHFQGRGPTREECNEVVGKDKQGEPITRAMTLGVEQHRLALKCAEDELKAVKPGGFTLSPRYRYDPVTEKAKYLPREAVQELLRQGRGAELRGTLEPDVVIHGGAPHQVQAVYDYKFPCMNTDEWSAWRQYREGHTYEGHHQGELYKQALKVDPVRVQPHLGVKR